MFAILRSLILGLCLAILPAVSGAIAQSDPPDYAEWKRVAARAQEAITKGRASETAMESLRKQVVVWRDSFTNYESQSNISVETLQAQLDSLGPVPEPADSEPLEIAEQRANLSEKLAAARVPIVQSQLAKTEADKLIEGIDKLLRERQASELLERGPTPLSPSNWSHGLKSLIQTYTHLVGEIKTAWVYEADSDEFINNALRFFGLGILGLVLMMRGAVFTSRLLEAIRREDMSVGRELISFCISLGYVLIPLLGSFLLVEGLYATDLAGLRGDRVIDTLPLATFLYLMPAWIGRRLFTDRAQQSARVKLNKIQLNKAQRSMQFVGAVMALYQMIRSLAGFDGWQTEARSVILFPIILLAGYLMLRFASLLRFIVKESLRMSDGGARYYDHFMTVIARFYQAAAIISLGLSLAGYTRAAEALIFPSIYTVQLVAFLIILHRLFLDLFQLAKGTDVDSDKALWPLVFTFLSVMASVPLLMFFWGMRPQEISEIYSKILYGFRVGDITISPSQLVIFLAVFSLGYALTKVIQSFLKNTFLPRTRLDIGAQNAIVAGLGYIGITLSAMVALNSTGINLGSIALVASALSVGIGFGLQTIVSNFVSGVILLIERPIAEGDWIEVNGQMGYVRDISVRSTRIETFDRTDVIVPNGDLVAGTVTNYTRGNTIGRVIVPIGVAYGTDPRLVERILLEVANAHPMVLGTPAPYVVFQGFGASSMDFEIRAILRDVNWVLSVRSDMNYEIAKRFMEEGIEIPFPQQDVWLRNAEPASHKVQVEPLSEEELKSVMQPDADGAGDTT